MAKKQFSPNDIVSNSLSIKKHDSYHSAPNYGGDIQSLRMVEAHIVSNGTVNGKPTVDLQFVDPDGNHYVVMTTGDIINSLSRVLVDS